MVYSLTELYRILKSHILKPITVFPVNQEN